MGLPATKICRIGRHLAAVVALVSVAPWLAFAQSSGTGSVVGHVRGPGGVAVPGATVELTEPQTGERKVTWTDASGNYALAGVKPGNYKLDVSLIGFRTDVREPVPVTRGQTLKVNVALVLSVPESSAPDAARRRIPAAGAFPELPVESGSPTGNVAAEGGGLNGSVPGGEATLRYTNNSGTEGSMPADSSTAGIEASASAANSFLITGGIGNGAPMPGEERGRWRERMQEFRRMRQAQSAPGFGGGGGGGFDRIFIGGPGPGGWHGRRPQINRVRGMFFDRYSNSALNAHPYPLNVAESPQIASYNEQLGIGLGGPLVIPKIYNGSNKTSFFVNYGLGRGRNPFDSFATVPTVAERSGDFSQAVIPTGPLAGTVPTIYDPLSNPDGPRAAFADNQIPSERLNPAAVGLLKYIPLPNLPGSVQNFHLQEALPTSSDRLMARVGHEISSKDSINAFYFFNSARNQGVSNFPGLTTNTSVRSQNLNLSETHTFSPGTINILLFNFNRQRNNLLNAFAFNQDISGELGIQGISTNPMDWGLPITQFTNFTGLNDAIPSLARNQTVRAMDSVIINRGKHNIHLGAELRRVELNTLTNPDARGTFSFTGYTTSDFSGGFPVPGTGFDFADFLLGLPQITSVRFGTSSNYFRSWVTSAFIQDDWRAASRVTFNFGLRYEYFLPFTEKYGHLSDLAIGPNYSSVAVVTGQDPGSLPASLIRSDANNLAPRIGLAYRPWLQHRLVLRAGYGIFYDGSIYSRLVPNLANQPPFAEASTLVTSPEQVLTLENGFPTIAPQITKNTYAVDSNFRTPYAQSWNFSLEDEIAPNVVMSIGYVGTKGTKLDLLLSPNPAVPGSPLAGQQGINALQFIYETAGAASIYHGLQVSVRRQFHGGFSMSGDYTFSKSIDNAAGLGGAGRTVAQDYLNLEAERGLSVFDARHRLIIDHNYELPFGERRRFLNHGGALARVLGNWQISGITTLSSGTPYTARVLGNQSNNSGTGAYSSQRADATGLPVSLPGDEQTTLEFFNPAAFTLPANGEFGDAGRNTIPGPGTVNFNMSLSRFLTISQEKGIRGDFRVQANNIFNTPNFGGLATVVNAQDFGRITSVRSMRELTFSFRLRF